MSNDAAQPIVVFAKTIVFIPFRDPKGQHHWADATVAYDANVPMWIDAADTAQMKGIDELLPHFRRLITGQGRRLEPTWRRYTLSPRAAKDLLPNLRPGAWKVPNLVAKGKVTSLEVTIFPTGEGVFELEYTWDRDETHYANEINTLLPLLRRMNGTPGQRFVPFWRFTEKPEKTPAANRAAQLAASGREQSFQFIDLLRNLSGNRADLEIAPTGLGIAHTSVVLESAPESETVRDALLFHLGHASPPTFVVPREIMRNMEVLERRGNRFIGIAREGAAAVAWPQDRAHLESEVEWARQRFHGVYRLLHTHVHAERLAIAELSDKAARFAGELDDERLLSQQTRIEKLLIEVATYTLSLTGEDCGGNGDHVAFFAGLRKMHHIAAQRDELRAEINELRALLRAVENARSSAVADAERTFQRRVSLVGFFAVPLTIALAVLGTNIDDNGQAHVFSGAEVLMWVAVSGAFFGALLAASRWWTKRHESNKNQ